jgi:threonyl-tRNA synthetase
MAEQKKPRDIQDVIFSILEVIPETEIKLRKELEKFSNKMIYKPPEMINCNENWLLFANVLNRNIPHIKEEWQIKIQKIVNQQ